MPPLDPSLLRSLLGAAAWSPVAVVATTGSTNADLLEGLRRGELAAGAVEVAAEQVSGRGRLDRAWSSPPGTSVALSAAVALPPGRPWTLLPLLAGLAVAEAVVELGAPSALKWPNDVLIGDRKCCGILVETATVGDSLHAVIGIGLNVSQAEAELPVPGAVSLALAGVQVSREEAAGTVLRHLDATLRDWARGGDVMARYRARSATLGRRVRLQLDATHAVEGQATDLAPDGRLGVTTDGALTWYAAGDIQHLRPA
ncbi:MAG: biotin--[acetyl-CoA-carboxylase] ligase [Propionibacteriaceae bacterium]|jgi:BirA family biotin operon repressor/biotin-[acetyl-CoA-carboxylase] ligase|nr:biotin--[acetyl-CoA-carboxylase] ligase [Propionibacteriaceae bacterium]